MANEEEPGAGEEPDERSSFFSRALGEDWVEVEPGIYERRAIRIAEPPSARTPAAGTPLAQELIESLPKAEEGDPDPAEVPEESQWWRFSL